MLYGKYKSPTAAELVLFLFNPSIIQFFTFLNPSILQSFNSS